MPVCHHSRPSPLKAVKKLKCEMTIVEGKTVYSSPE
jgi:predicted amidohydrolase YtcJ